MKGEIEASGNSLGAREAPDESARVLTAFSQTSAIELAVYDNQLRFRAVNHAAALITGTPAEAFVGNTIRDIIGDAAPEPEARLRRVLIAGETPPVEVTAMLPQRTELGYWIQKIFPIEGQSGKVTQIACLAIEVTAHRKLEERFRKLTGEPLWRNEEYQRLARDLHDSINGYHVALGMNLDRLSRCTKDPERIPQLLAQAMEFLDEHMRRLAAAVARCFALDQQQ
jgi:PAS domain S-box-containing protein